jgi:hypothetical protein
VNRACLVLRRGKHRCEVDAVDLEDVIAEPAVERVRRRAEASRRSLDVIGLEG